jgi:hypothetical protein
LLGHWEIFWNAGNRKNLAKKLRTFCTFVFSFWLSSLQKKEKIILNKFSAGWQQWLGKHEERGHLLFSDSYFLPLFSNLRSQKMALKWHLLPSFVFNGPGTCNLLYSVGVLYSRKPSSKFCWRKYSNLKNLFSCIYCIVIYSTSTCH